MYDFLAPWGALLPLFSALISYTFAAEIRRRKHLKFIHAPATDEERPFSAVHCPLSLMHG